VKYLFACTLFLLIADIFSGFAWGQDMPTDAAPPPFKLISKSERSQLSAANEVKDHTVLALELMDTRLKGAERSLSNEDYQLMYAELGGFHALMDNTLGFLLRAGPHQGKVLSSLKRFEIALRSFVPRVESIRRELPYNFEPYVRNLLKYISQTREKAIEPFFSDTVTPNTRNQ
jgi:hypothetical protein